jgi:uncharacterized protein (TIGR02453 family)
MPATAFFTPELFAFLRQLKRNNNREWFTRNKQRYTELAVEPAMRFIEAFAEPLAGLSENFVADARPTRGSLFRIYRDTRFSPDAPPYKTHVGIHFSHAKGKDVHAPIFYLHLEPAGCFAAAGVWHPDSPALTRIRQAIVQRPAEWKKATAKIELVGESLVRPPKGFDPASPLIADLKRKDFCASVELSEEQICSAKLLANYTAACRKMAGLVEFTATALGLPY